MGTLELWRDGLICAYEFIPAPSGKIKMGAEFNNGGPLEGRFDAEISLKQPHGLSDNPKMDSIHSQKSLESSPSGSPKSAPNSLGTEIQGFVVRESLKKNDEKSTSSPGYGDRLDHRPSGKMGKSSQWIPIGWQRLTELFQEIQVRTCALYRLLSQVHCVSDKCLFSGQRFKGPTWKEAWCKFLSDIYFSKRRFLQ